MNTCRVLSPEQEITAHIQQHDKESRGKYMFDSMSYYIRSG